MRSSQSKKRGLLKVLMIQGLNYKYAVHIQPIVHLVTFYLSRQTKEPLVLHATKMK